MEDEWQIVQQPTPEAAVDPGEDAVKSAAAQGTLGFGDIVSLPGFVGQGIQSGVKYLARKGMEGSNKYLGTEIPVEQVMADVERGSLEPLSEEERKAVQEGRAIPSAEMGTLPTPFGVEQSIKSSLPYTQYESKTPTGKLTGAASRFAAGSAIGPIRTAPLRIAEGALAGTGSEVAGEYALKNFPEYETYARLAGAIGSPAAAKFGWNTVKPWAMPQTFADEKTIELLAQDIRNGTSKMKPDDIKAAIANGATPSVIDMAGNKTREWISKRYGVSMDMLDSIEELNNMMAARAGESRGRLRTFLEDKYKGLSNMSIENQMTTAQEAERKLAYDIANNSPNAMGVWNAEIQSLTNNGYIKDVMDKVKSDFSENRIPKKWNVVPPMGNFPPNLQYWNVVKQELDAIISKNRPNKLTGTGNQSVFESAQEAKKELVKALDDAVPEYAAARDSHSELLGYTSAPDAGNAFASANTASEINDLLGLYSKYNDGQKELFRRGVVRSLYDQLGSPSGSVSGFVKRMTSENAKENFVKVLGEDQYNTLLGRATAEDIMSKAKAIKEMPGGTAAFAAKEGAKAGALLAAGQVANIFIHGGPSIGGVPALASGIAAIGSVGKDLALNYAERRVAPRVVELMRSSHPDDLVRLGDLIAKNPDAGSFVGKISNALSTAPMRYLQSQQTSEYATPESWSIEPSPENYDIVPAQASGGRIGRKSGGRTIGNPISAEVKRVRALLSEKTASMLSVPDDAIATALHIAKET